MNKNIPPDLIKQILEKNLFSGDFSGKKRLAAAMAAPLRTTRDYSSVSRKTFLADQLPGFHCPACGHSDSDERYIHSTEECIVGQVTLT